jgi:hypothetical protein
LKIGGFIAADTGQMDLYLSWLKEHEWRDGESEPVNLVLCTPKRRQHVELLLRHGPHKLQVAEYVLKPPQKKALEGRRNRLQARAARARHRRERCDV